MLFDRVKSEGIVDSVFASPFEGGFEFRDAVAGVPL